MSLAVAQPAIDFENTVQSLPPFFAVTAHASFLPRVREPPRVKCRLVAPLIGRSGCGMAWISWPGKRGKPQR
jgi:hypothetical protein